MKANQLDEIKPVRLRLELKDDYLSDYDKIMLKRYGESISGDSIIRDILIPADMPLHNLHYVIQRLFGWQNYHLHSFNLPDEDYERITKGTVRGWSKLVGILFQPPAECEEDIFWDDDYRSGNYKTWLRKKYTGPYYYGGYYEHYENAQKDIQELLEYYKMVNVRESFESYLKHKDVDDTVHIINQTPLIDLTLEEMKSNIAIHSINDLLERLEVAKILATKDESLNDDGISSITKEIIYEYDFGVSWEVIITKYKGCDDLINDNLISKEELQDAVNIVLDKYQPVCIHRQGVNVFDDAGGLSGFAEFLGTIYEGEDKEEIADMKAWSKYLGWSDKKISPKKML